MMPDKNIHSLVVIGSIGDKRLYLDIPIEEAVQRYTTSEGAAPFEHQIKVIDFVDELRAYDVFEDW